MSCKNFYKFCQKIIGQLLIAGLLVFLFFSLSGCEFNKASKSETDQPQELEKITQKEPVLFNWTNRPVAIMIENFKKARPISGLLKARIVYEAPVEADITRFLAIFQKDNLPTRIGPVRSARPYFLDWAEEYNSLFVHAGGSPSALKGIRDQAYNIYNLDEISQDGKYFFRDQDKISPHNLYSSNELIKGAFNNKEIPELNNNISGWYYKENTKNPDKDLLGVLKIKYRQDAVWKYEKDLNRYLRYENGAKLLNDKDIQLNASNIVIQKTKIQQIDDIGRKSIKTTGSGEVIVFKNGQVVNGFWEKLKGDKKTRFYKKNGEEIIFSPGIVWIHIVSEDSEVDYY